MSNKDYVEPLGRAFLRVLFIGCFEIGSRTAWVARPGAERLGPAAVLQWCSGRESLCSDAPWPQQWNVTAARGGSGAAAEPSLT